MLPQEQDDPVVGRLMTGLPPVLPSLSKPQTQPLTSSMPALSSAGLPPVTAPPPVQSPEEQRVSQVRSKLDKLENTAPATTALWNKAGQYHQEHPGVVGRLGQVGAGILRGVDIAGETLMPKVAQNIPGSILNRNQQVKFGQNELKEAETERGTAAQANLHQAQIPETEATTAKTRRETELLGQPKPKEEEWSAESGVTGPGGESVLVEKTSGTQKLGQKVQPLKPNEPKDEDWSVVPGVTTPDGHLLEHEKRSNQLRVADEVGGVKPTRPQQEPGNYTPVPDEKGNTIGWINPKTRHFVGVEDIRQGGGAPLSSNQAPGGVLPPKPTAATMTQAQGSKAVLDQSKQITPMVDALAAKVGPVAGRWNSFWVNKAGVNDPAYAQLDQQLKLYASGVVRVHFGARGGGQQFIQKMMDDFHQAQSPENLKARIAGADNVLRGYAQQAGVIRMRAPNGQEQYVDPSEVEGYKSKGATVIK